MKAVNREMVITTLSQSWRRTAFHVLIALVLVLQSHVGFADMKPRKVVFEGVKSEYKWALKDLDPNLPSDWSSYNYLVMELRTSTPQRFFLWIYTADGPRRLVLHPFGQNVWLRASVPLQYFKGKDQSGHDLASTNNRRTDSYWFSVWGPFGELKNVEALGVTMQYPLNKPTLEIRSMRLTSKDAGSDFLEKKPVLDEFGQWAHADWPRKIRSHEQLEKELAEEEKNIKPGNFNYCEYGGYLNTKARATGFFRVEQIDGRWWLVDPHGHLFLSMGSNGIGWGPARRRMRVPSPASAGASLSPRMRGAGLKAASPREYLYTMADLVHRRMDAWGLTTVGNWSDPILWQAQRKAYVMTFRSPRTEPSYLGMTDVYSEDFARSVDESAERQCAPRRSDPLLIGYFIGNEPPWPGRESELVGMFLNGPETATQRKLKAFLAEGDTPQRREQFIHAMFKRYLSIICDAIRKHDPNHLNLGIRFGGSPPDEVLRMGSVFDVCSINMYEYEPTKQMKRVYELTGRPILIGEFHFGVPANGLGAGLVQVADQKERGVGYRYYVEQAAALPCFLGTHWFIWRDEPVLGRMDGENYNIGFVDVTDRPYRELVEAAIATHKRLYEVHIGKVLPFSQRPKASAAGTPDSPWQD